MKKAEFVTLVFVTCLGASIITVGSQFYYIYTNLGRDWIKRFDFERHQEKIAGTAQAPYRYRLLSDYLLEGVLRLVPYTTPAKQQAKYEWVAFGFRIVQNLGIFLLAFWYFRTLEIPRFASLLGIVLLSSGMCFAFYMSDLSFYTYTELAFFFLGGIVINRRRDWWIVPLTLVAALNREEAIFIPAVLLSARLCETDWRSLSVRKFLLGRWVHVCGLSLIGFAAVYLGVRYVLGSAAYAASRYGPVFPGLQLFQMNLLNIRTWVGLVQMYGLLPLTLVSLNSWPKMFKAHLLFLVLPWFITILSFASADETRLFLVPFSMVFVPVALNLVFLNDAGEELAKPIYR